MKIKILYSLLALLSIWLIGAGAVKVYSKHYTKLHCSDFINQQDAQKAYHNGALYLDGDKDGIVCESLIPIHER